MSHRRLCSAFVCFLASAPFAAGFNIALNYDYDTYFATHPEAKTSLERAAADLSAAITSPLAAINSDTFTGTVNGTSVTADWRLNVVNPTTGATVTLQSFVLPANVFTLYVGMRSLTGTTMGQAGPSSAQVGLVNASGDPVDWTAAVDKMEATSNAGMSRGDHAPIIGAISGSANYGGSPGNFTLPFGPLAGSLWFDQDTNNDGAIDDDATMDAYWHFDSSTPVPGNQRDLYSVALHEMVHTIGAGGSKTWQTQVSGTSWLGANAIALNGGSGANLIGGDGSHLSLLLSPRLTDGGLQEVLMNSTLSSGERKFLTQMDAAILRDLGYTTVPEPSAWILLAGAAVSCGVLRRRRHS
jgi:hypothetical protein